MLRFSEERFRCSQSHNHGRTTIMNLSRPLDGNLPSIKMGEYVLTLEVECGEEYEDIARRELRETPEIVAAAKEKLRELLKGEVDLLVALSDDFLVTFLRPCKYYPESAFKKITSTYKFCLKNKNISENLVPSIVPKPYEEDLLVIIPKRDHHGRRTLVIEAGKKWNPEKCSVVDFFRGALLIIMVSLVEPKTQICGANVIFDFEGLSMKQIMQITPSIAYAIVFYVQECLALRLKAIHVVNQAYIFDILFSLFKPLLSSKLRSRIHFHGNNWESLHKHIKPDCLPLRFGGNMDIPMDVGIKIHELMCEFENEFQEQTKYGYVVRKNKKNGRV